MPQFYNATEQEGLLISNGSEDRDLEFKGPMNWDDKLTRILILKAIMALSNLRDGGYIIVGVKNDGALSGLTKKQALSFYHDKMSSILGTCTLPPVRFSLRKVKFKAKFFVILKIFEFRDVPTICKSSLKAKDNKGKYHEIKAGHIYIRPLHRNESTDIIMHQEMRELLDYAVDKEIRKLGERRGFWLEREETPQGEKPKKVASKPKSNRKSFEEQIKDL